MRIVVTRVDPEFDFKVHVFASHMRLDALFYGVFLSYLWHFEPEWLAPFIRHRRWLLVATLGLVSPAMFLSQHNQFMRSVGLSCLSVGFTALLLWVLTAKKASGSLQALGRALAWVGLHSYSIYLWHAPAAARSALSVGLGRSARASRARPRIDERRQRKQ